MWKKEDTKPQGVAEVSLSSVPSLSTTSSAPANSAHTAHTQSVPAPVPVSPRAAACISQGIKIKGEITGSEDLFVDGQVDGQLNLTNGSVTIGPNGRVKADVNAREVIVRGQVEGKVTGRDRVQLWSTGQLSGEVQTDRLAIEEGAVLHGKIEAGKLPTKAREARAASAAPTAEKSPDALFARSGSSTD
jgi:cytoskeletal protein CcmA (bactofilin family)